MLSSSPLSRHNQPPVGRVSVFQHLSHQLQRAMAGYGNLVLLSGEAGIGKSHLAACLRDEASANGALVLTGNSYDLSASPPYGPWRQILSDRKVLDTLPGVPALFGGRALTDPVQNQAALFSEVVHLTGQLASERTLLLILEDLHWADVASIDLLRAVGRNVDQHPVMIVATYRSDELTREHPLYRRIPALLREAQAARIELQPLDIEATAELVRARFALAEGDEQRLVDYLNDRAQGNPFFIEELLYALLEAGSLHEGETGWHFAVRAGDSVVQPVPELVRQVIDSRLERLSPDVRRQLEIAAVIGQEVPLDLWQALSDADDEMFIAAIRGATESQFLQEPRDGRTLQFRHALVRDALYSAVVLPERRTFHLRCGEYLAATNAADPDRVANHFLQAHDPRAVEWLARSGEHALAAYAPDNAIERLSRGLELAAAFNIEPPATMSRLRGLAYAMEGEFTSALSDYTTALETARATADWKTEWQVSIDLGTLWSERDYARTRDLYAGALELARLQEDDAAIAHSLNRVGNWHLNNDQPTEAIERHQEALATFKRNDDLPGVAQTVRMLGMSYLVRGDLVRSSHFFHEAADLFTALDDRLGLCAVLTGLVYTGGTYTFHSEIAGPLGPAELEEIGNRAVQLAVDTRWRSGEAYVCCALGSHHGVRGNYRQALDFTLRGLDIATQIGHREWMALAHQILGRLHLDLFAIEEARRHLEKSLRLAETAGAPIHSRLARSYLAYVHLADGHVDRALETLEQTHLPTHPGTTVIERKCQAARASVALGVEDPELALSISEQLLNTTLNQTETRIVPLYGRLCGEALTQMGRYDEAEQQLTLALTGTTTDGFRPMLWRLHAALGRLYQSSGRAPEAAGWFGQAHELVEELSQSIPDDELRETFLLEARHRIPTPRQLTPLQSAKYEYSGLTARQREVAALVARGYSNSEIAATLSISPRTAEGHVTAILTALDFTSRAQIAAWAVDRGLVKL